MVIEKQMSIWLFSVDYIKVSVENKKIKVIKLKKAIKILKNGKLTAVHAEVMKGYSELGLSWLLEIRKNRVRGVYQMS